MKILFPSFPCYSICISNLHLSTLRYDNRYLRFVVGSSGNILNLAHHQQPLDDTAKHHMLPIKEVTFSTSNKKLAAIGVLPTVGLSEKKQKH